MGIVYWFEDNIDKINAQCKKDPDVVKGKEPPSTLAVRLLKIGWDLVPIEEKRWEVAKDMGSKEGNVLWVIDLKCSHPYPETDEWAKKKLSDEHRYLKSLANIDAIPDWPYDLGLAVVKTAIEKKIEYVVASGYTSATWFTEIMKLWHKNEDWRDSVTAIPPVPDGDSISEIVQKARLIAGYRGVQQLSLRQWIKIKSIGYPLRDRLSAREDLDQEFISFLGGFHVRHILGGALKPYDSSSFVWKSYQKFKKMPEVILLPEAVQALEECGYDPRYQIEGKIDDWTHPPFRAILDDYPSKDRDGDLRNLIGCWGKKGKHSLLKKIDTAQIRSEHDFLWFNITRCLRGINGLAEITKRDDGNAKIGIWFKSIGESEYSGGILGHIMLEHDIKRLEEYNKWLPYTDEHAYQINYFSDFYKDFLQHIFESGASWFFYAHSSYDQKKCHFVFLNDNGRPSITNTRIIELSHPIRSPNIDFDFFFAVKKGSSIFKDGTDDIVALDHESEFNEKDAFNLTKGVIWV